MENTVKLSKKFKEKTSKYFYKGELNRETVIERVYKLGNGKRIVEGLILKHQARDNKTGEFYDRYRYIVAMGYHYFILQVRKEGEKRYTDIEGFQGNIRDGNYHYFIYNTSPTELIEGSIFYGDALTLFCKRNELDVENDYQKIKNDYQRIEQLAIEKGLIKTDFVFTKGKMKGRKGTVVTDHIFSYVVKTSKCRYEVGADYLEKRVKWLPRVKKNCGG